ncbi:MAG: PIG-L family deacetylase [Planctomycetota bacterium]
MVGRVRSARGRALVGVACALLSLAACAAPVPRTAGRPQTVAVPAHGASLHATAPRVLVVIAHPDDELAFAGVLFKTARHLGGVCEVLTITDGQGGFKYATLGAALHGLDLTDEALGRRELPRLRFEEQLEAAQLLGLRALHYLGQKDHRYTTDLAEVLGEDAQVWDLAAVRRALDVRLAEGRYDFVLVHPPTATTHAHHQAASLLALEAVQRMAPAARPLVLCAEVEDGPENGAPWIPPATSAAHPGARVAGGPFLFDRTQPFGYRDRLDYTVVVNAAIARHVTQGSMLRLIGQGTREEYWLLGEPREGGVATCEAWFARLAERQYPSREYAESAGINTGTNTPNR